MINITPLSIILRHRFPLSIFEIKDDQYYSQISVSKEIVDAAIARYEFFKDDVDYQSITRVDFDEARKAQDTVRLAYYLSLFEGMTLHVINTKWHKNDDYHNKIISITRLWGQLNRAFYEIDEIHAFAKFYNPDDFPEQKIQKTPKWDQDTLPVVDIFNVIDGLRLHYKSNGFENRISRNSLTRDNFALEQEIEQIIKSRKKIYALVIDIHVPSQVFYKQKDHFPASMEIAVARASEWYPVLQKTIAELPSLQVAYCNLETDGMRGFNLHTLLLINKGSKITEKDIIDNLCSLINKKTNKYSEIFNLNFSIRNWNKVIEKLSGKQPAGYLNNSKLQNFREWIINYFLHADLLLDLTEMLNDYGSDLNAFKMQKIEPAPSPLEENQVDHNINLEPIDNNHVRKSKKKFPKNFKNEPRVMDLIALQKPDKIWNENLLDKSRLAYYRAIKVYVQDFFMLPPWNFQQDITLVEKFTITKVFLNIELFMLLLEQRNWNKLRGLSQHKQTLQTIKSGSDECYWQFISLLESLQSSLQNVKKFYAIDKKTLNLVRREIFGGYLESTIYNLKIKTLLNKPLNNESIQEIDRWLEKIRNAQLNDPAEHQKSVERDKCYKQINTKFPYVEKLLKNPSLAIRCQLSVGIINASTAIKLAPKVLTNFIKFLRLKIKKSILKGYVGHWIETEHLTADIVLFFDLYSVSDQMNFHEVIQNTWSDFQKSFVSKTENYSADNELYFKVIHLFGNLDPNRALIEIFSEKSTHLKKQFIDSLFNFYCFCDLFYASSSPDSADQNISLVRSMRKRFIKGSDGLIVVTPKLQKTVQEKKLVSNKGDLQNELVVEDSTDLIGNV